MSGGKPLTLSLSKGSAVQSPNLSSPQRHEKHEGNEMTDDGRAPAGRSAVFGRLSTIVKSFHARTEIALAGFTTRKPDSLQLNSFLAQPVAARYRRIAKVMSTAFLSSVVLAALPIYVSRETAVFIGFFWVFWEEIFTTETQRSQSSEYFLIKNSFLCALCASAVQTPSLASHKNLKNHLSKYFARIP